MFKDEGAILQAAATLAAAHCVKGNEVARLIQILATMASEGLIAADLLPVKMGPPSAPAQPRRPSKSKSLL